MKKRCNGTIRTDFTHEMKLLEKKGLVFLNPKVINKQSGKLHEMGRYITCIPCKLFRPRMDGNINLRRNYYDYYYHQHTQNQAHISAKHLYDRKLKIDKMSNKNEKQRVLTQSMMSSFLVPRVRNTRTTITTANASVTNNQPETTNAINDLETNNSNEQNTVNIESNESDKRYEINHYYFLY